MCAAVCAAAATAQINYNTVVGGSDARLAAITRKGYVYRLVRPTSNASVPYEDCMCGEWPVVAPSRHPALTPQHPYRCCTWIWSGQQRCTTAPGRSGHCPYSSP